MTHAAMDPEARARAGISQSLLRVSIGIEDKRDLLADLEVALGRAVSASLLVPQMPRSAAC
jgi:cystathionine gamma-synthase